MPGSGSTTVDFGVFPGSSHATVDITGQTGIAGSSLVEAWLMPKDTADHSADEHVVEDIKVVAGPANAGVGFTVHALNMNPLFEPLESVGPSTFRPAAATVHGYVQPSRGGMGTRLYGQWTIGWVWR